MANNVNVTNRGFEYLTQYMALPNNNSSNGGWTTPTAVGWGGANGYNSAGTVLPGSAPSATQGTGQWSDIAPYQEYAENRTVGTVTVTGNTAAAGTVITQVVATITSLSNQSVGESFLGFSTSKPTPYTVNGTVTTVQTSLTVGTSGVTINSYVQMNNEVIKVSATAASNVWTIARAQNGSSANAAKANDVLTFGNVPGSGASNPANGDLFAHAGFQALALNTNDSIQFTWQINVTS